MKTSPSIKTLSATIDICLSILEDAGYATYALISPEIIIETFYSIYDEDDIKITPSFLNRIQEHLKANFDAEVGINTNIITNAIMDEYNTVGL